MQSILGNNEFDRFSGITIGKVYKVSSAGNMVDVILLDGTVLKDVQVTVSFASSRSGSTGLPISDYKEDMMDKDLPLSSARITESDAYAVVGFLGGSIQRPIVLGFLFPENCEILCGRDQKGNKDGTQFLWKHESNVYVRVAKGYTDTTVDMDPVTPTPDIEIGHPSGLLIKIGAIDLGAGWSNPDPVLRAQARHPRTEVTNWDKDIRPFKYQNPETNKADPAPYFLIYHPSGTYISISPSGETWIDTIAKLNVEVHGDMSVEVDGNVTRTIKGNLTETIQGDATTEVKGTWLRKSDVQIEDKCGVIHHNK